MRARVRSCSSRGACSRACACSSDLVRLRLRLRFRLRIRVRVRVWVRVRVRVRVSSHRPSTCSAAGGAGLARGCAPA